jgi:hypothetical protein
MRLPKAGQALEGQLGYVAVAGVVAELLPGVQQDFIDDRLVLGQLGGGGNEGRIGGRILRLHLLDGFNVAGVGDDGGHCAELLEQGLRHGIPPTYSPCTLAGIGFRSQRVPCESGRNFVLKD